MRVRSRNWPSNGRQTNSVVAPPPRLSEIERLAAEARGCIAWFVHIVLEEYRDDDRRYAERGR